MKYYVQYKMRDLAGKVVDAMGSDGVFILDGRNTIATMIEDAKTRMEKLELVQPYYLGFEINRGDRFEKPITLYGDVMVGGN